MTKSIEMELLAHGDIDTKVKTDLTPVGDGRSFIAPSYEGPGRYHELEGVKTVLVYSHDRVEGSVYRLME